MRNKSEITVQKTIKYLALTCITTLSCIGLQKFCRSKTDGFAESKIHSDMQFHQEFQTSTLSVDEIQKIDTILSQPFYYLGKGVQCYAFVSKDEKYVIKFLRLDRLCPSILYSQIALPSFLKKIRDERVDRKFGELSRDFISYKIAYDLLKNYTGLEYIQLNKNGPINKKITLYDKINVLHEIDLKPLQFLIQKKADLFYVGMQKMLDRGDKDKARSLITQLVEYLCLRSSMGFYDKDPDINTNFGIQDDVIMQIDVGRFRHDITRMDPQIYINDVIRITDNFQQWLEARDKGLSDHLLSEIERIKLSKLKNNEDKDC